MYFQNVFPSEFAGYLLLSDRQFNITFRIPANRNQFVNMVAWADAPYNTVGNTTLTFNYSIDNGYAYYALPVSITSGSAVTVETIVTDLNADSNFAAMFIAEKRGTRLAIRYTGASPEKFRVYISNTSAETILKFNKMAGVAELPSYFERHTIANRNTYDDSVGMLVKLTQPTDNQIITDAGLSTTAKADYELLAGRAGLFTFQKITVDGSNRITQIIEYPAGAVAGDLSRKINYSYDGANTSPSQITEIPYTLATGDLVTPP